MAAVSVRKPAGQSDQPESVFRSSEVPQCRKGFSLTEAKAFIDQVIEVLHTQEDLSDLKTVYETGKQLSRLYFDCHIYRTELAQYLTELEFPAFASKMMKRLNNLGVFRNDDIWFSSFYFYHTAWNFSDILPEFATGLAAAGLPNLLNLNIGHQPYLDNLSSKNVYYLIKASLSVIHNIARVPGNGHYFAVDTVKSALLNLAQREEEFLRCVSTLCLAYIIPDSETHLLEASSVDSVGTLMNYIGQARKSEKRRCHGFLVNELLAALVALASNTTTKKAVVDAGGVDVLKNLIEGPPAQEKEIIEATSVLWQLAFNDETKDCMLKQFDIGVLLQGLGNHSNPLIGRLAESAYWTLTEMQERANGVVTTKSHVFISYPDSAEEVVSRVRDRLKEAGIKVWLGDEEARVSAVAGAIESAAVVVVCVGDGLKWSPRCRAEVEYSKRLRKTLVPVLVQTKYKADGWVAALVGESSFDLSGRRESGGSMDLLISHLEELMNEPVPKEEVKVKPEGKMRKTNSVDEKRDDDDKQLKMKKDEKIKKRDTKDNKFDKKVAPPSSGDKADESRLTTAKIPAPSDSVDHSSISKVSKVERVESPARRADMDLAKQSIRSWSTLAVADWLSCNGIGHLAINLRDIDGHLLAQLADLRRRAPEFFYRSLESKLSLSFVDILKLSAALQSIDDGVAIQ